MKRLFTYASVILLICCAVNCCAQDSKPLKGTFINGNITANINLYAKTIETEQNIAYNDKQQLVLEQNAKCYGSIVITGDEEVYGYDIIYVEALDSPEPNFWIISWEEATDALLAYRPDRSDSLQLDDLVEPQRVGYYYDPSNKTLTLYPWGNLGILNDLTLKKK